MPSDNHLRLPTPEEMRLAVRLRDTLTNARDVNLGDDSAKMLYWSDIVTECRALLAEVDKEKP